MANVIGEVDGIVVKVRVEITEPYWVAMSIDENGDSAVALLDEYAVNELIAVLQAAQETRHD